MLNEYKLSTAILGTKCEQQFQPNVLKASLRSAYTKQSMAPRTNCLGWGCKRLTLNPSILQSGLIALIWISNTMVDWKTSQKFQSPTCKTYLT